MIDASTLDTKKISLRHFVPNDLNNLITLVTTPPYGKFSPFGQNNTAFVKENFENTLIQFYNNPGYELWCVIDKQKDNFSGYAGYHPVTFEDTVYIMYFCAFQKQYWDSTIPLEATSLACNFAFNENIPKLVAFINPYDIATLTLVKEMKGKLVKEAPFFGASVFLFSLEKENAKIPTKFN